MSEDRYPKAREELEVENRELRAAVARLQSSVGSLQATIIARETEIANLRRPKKSPHLLDKNAKDKFDRPAYSARRYPL
jgi:cell division septum initiation protein DivIVA